MRKATTIILALLLAGLLGLSVHSYFDPSYTDINPERAAWTFFCVDGGSVTFCHTSDGDLPDLASGRQPKTQRETERVNRYSRAHSKCQSWNSFADSIKQQARIWPGNKTPYPDAGENCTVGDAWVEIVDDCLRNIRKPYAGELARFAGDDGILGFYWFHDNTNQRKIVLRTPLWAPAVLLTAPFVLLARAQWTARRRRKEGCCLKCGYNLTGNVSGICPECGTAITQNTIPTSTSG